MKYAACVLIILAHWLLLPPLTNLVIFCGHDVAMVIEILYDHDVAQPLTAITG